MRVDRRKFSGDLLLLLMMIILGLQPGCRHTPSYEDIKVDKGGGLANTNSAPPQPGPSVEQVDPIAANPESSPASAPGSSPGSVPGSSPAFAAGSSPSPDTSAGASPTPPGYLDQKTGQIKNLPLYPHAKLRSFRFGPINGISQVTVQAFTRAPFEKVTAFYDQVVKQNGWTIDDNGREANSYTWQLSRGQDNKAAIRVDKDQLGRVIISLARTN